MPIRDTSLGVDRPLLPPVQDLHRMQETRRTAEVDMSVRTELVQVAAVAIAIIEDIDGPGNVDWSWDDVSRERIRQEKLWGEQHHPIERWLAILGEEVGEAFKAANDEVIFPRQDRTEGDPVPEGTPECEHGWTMEHCTKDAEGSCPWNGSKHEIGRGPWADQECHCPGPGVPA